jgi:hypothetical protein
MLMRALCLLSVPGIVLSLACSDAKPGIRPGEGGAGGSAGGTTSAGGSTGGSTPGPVPDFSMAEVTPLARPDASENDDYFGCDVDLSGDSLIVGAYRHGLNDPGAAHVFVRQQEQWSLQATLSAQSGSDDDWFGWSVAISGDLAAVGARGHNVPEYAGLAYAFERGGQSWNTQSELTTSPPVSEALLGSAVAVSGSVILAGAPDFNSTRTGKVIVFEPTPWNVSAELTPEGTAQSFGAAVALDGDTALVGARGLGDPGAAFVFVRDGSTWTQQAELTPGDGAASKHFGHAVALSGDTAVVGTDAEEDLGTAYVFVREGTSWTQQAQLLADDGEPGDELGFAVAVSGNAVIVGAPGDDDAGIDAGAAYVFGREGTTWSQRTKLLRPGGATDERFGYAVAIDGKVAAVTAANGSDGSVTVFMAP